MISFYETMQGRTWAVVLDERGHVISRRRVPFKKAPYLGVWESRTSAEGTMDGGIRSRPREPAKG